MTTILAIRHPSGGRSKDIKEARLLYYSRGGVAWVALPHDPPTALYLAPDPANEQSYYKLSDVPPSATFDRIAVVPIDSAWGRQLPPPDPSAEVSGATAQLPPDIAGGLDLVRWAIRQPSQGILRRIARAVSSTISVPLDATFDLSSLLGALKSTDIVATTEPSKVVFSRSVQLQHELTQILRERFLVFLLGGVRSGKSALASTIGSPPQPGRAHHVAAEFDEAIYDGFSGLAESVDQLVGCRDRNPQLNRLLATLAYAAFKGSFPSTRPQRRSGVYARFGFPEALANPREFGHLFMAELRPQQQPIASLLHFFKVLSQLSDHDSSEMTVFLPFEKLGAVLAGGPRQNDFIWDALMNLRTSEFDAQGGLRKDSELRAFVGRLGLVVIAESVTFERITEAVLGELVLLLPPMEAAEIRDCVETVFSASIEGNELAALLKATGGIPWFVALVLECARLTPDGWAASIERAIPMIRTMLRTSPDETPADLDTIPGAADVWDTVRRYKVRVSRRLHPGDARAYDLAVAAHKPHYNRRGGYSLDTDLYDLFKNNDAIRRLYTAGLLWLTPPQGRPHRLRAFGGIPVIQLAPRADLVTTLLNAIEAETAAQ